jgi:hypothetical protein
MNPFPDNGEQGQTPEELFHGGESGSIPLGSAIPAGRTVNGSMNFTDCGSIAVHEDPRANRIRRKSE